MKLIVLLIILVTTNTFSYSQTVCGTGVFYNSQSNPQGQNLLGDIGCPSITSDLITIIEIPVIVHVMYNDNFENVGYQDVVSMIDNANNFLAPEEIDGFQVDINLRLAENGTCTPGFERVYIDDPNYRVYNENDVTSEELRVKSQNVWPTSNFLNVWIVDNAILVGATEGFAWTAIDFEYFGEENIIDGVVMDNNYLYSFIHEFGHWADLYHLDETYFNPTGELCEGSEYLGTSGYGCGFDDQVEDTEPMRCSIPFTFEDDTEHSCEDWIIGFGVEYNPNYQIWPNCYLIISPNGQSAYWRFPADNIMTYCNKCWTGFTPGQYTRMIVDLNSRRQGILESETNFLNIVDLTQNTTHTTVDLLNRLGVISTQELCNNPKKYIIKLGGELILDSGINNPICLSSETNIIMEKDAIITISNSTTLNLDNVHIFSCDEFWDQIYVYSGSTININNNSLIENAFTAINSEKGANINISGTNFKNNFTGLVFNELGSGNCTNISLSNTTFESNENFNYILLDRPLAGIKIINQKGLNLNSTENEQNTFRRLQNGINANNSTFHISNAVFEDIQPPSFDYNPLQLKYYNNGFAIKSLNSKGVNIYKENSFNDVRYGIGQLNGMLVALDNEMTDMKEGISGYNLNGIRVYSNNIDAEDIGIYLANCNPWYYVGDFLLDNTIEISSQSDAAKGIQIEDTDIMHVYENFITMRGNEAGIFSQNSGNGNLHDNTIEVFGNTNVPTSGIYIINSQRNTKVINNYVEDFTARTDNIGIHFLRANSSDIECNYMSDFDHGMKFWDECDFSFVAGNEYYGNQRDMVLGNYLYTNDAASATWIGPQGDVTEGNGNLWPSLNSLAHNSGTKELIDQSIFYVNGVGDLNSDYIPDIIESEGKWFYNDQFTANANPCHGTPGAGYALDCSDIIERIHWIENMSEVDPCKKQIWLEKYYKQLVNLNLSGELSPECLQFLQSQSNNVLVKIANISAGIDSLGTISQNTVNLLNQVFTISLSLDSMQSNGLDGTQEYNTLMHEYITFMEQYNASLSVDMTRDSLSNDSLRTEIGRIFVQDTCLKTLLEVFDIKLKLLQNDSLDIRDKQILSEIADACPQDMGDGVFYARSMMSLFENKRFRVENDCIDGEIRIRSEKEQNDTYIKMVLYPNPAISEVSVLINTYQDETGTLSVIDTKGQTIFKSGITHDQADIIINTSKFISGIYLVEYINELTGSKEIQKLMITK